jgi:hypothetical protein
MQRILIAGLAVGLALPALAQNGTLTLEQVQRRYRAMNMVHIAKCDYDADQRFNKAEQLCLAGLYRAMYRERG